MRVVTSFKPLAKFLSFFLLLSLSKRFSIKSLKALVFFQRCQAGPLCFDLLTNVFVADTKTFSVVSLWVSLKVIWISFYVSTINVFHTKAISYKIWWLLIIPCRSNRSVQIRYNSSSVCEDVLGESAEGDIIDRIQEFVLQKVLLQYCFGREVKMTKNYWAKV